MHFFIKLLGVVLAGVILGLGGTLLMLERGVSFGAVKAGPWTASPHNGSLDVDPYARAMFAYTGELPLGAAEGIGFTAQKDSMGAPLNAHCDYIVSGHTPQARYWTMTLLSPEGLPVANAARRYGFTSAEILRAPGGNFEIALSRHARPGNWLPIGDASKFMLVLRLYDPDLNIATLSLDEASLPALIRKNCR
ncbi:DUF1214 domain-containing protein [Methylocapsa palsarum]|uniref:DUF1214 domain-containing protein n=1 Tax=Methylocapsa palsarum TaxID=1612308 RepID=UPI001FCD103F|nr:DUF1214 domain-containing protein [Methylocapsa palsarum]